MPINITTVYTKERLLQFSKVIASMKKLFWIFMALCTVFVIGVGAFAWMLSNEMSLDIMICIISIIVLDTIYLFFYVIWPHITVGKAKNLNTVVKYAFEEDSFRTEAVNAYSNEKATVQYSILNKIVKTDDNLYLFISSHQAYIVDLEPLSAEQTDILKGLLESKISPKKIKWH